MGTDVRKRGSPQIIEARIPEALVPMDRRVPGHLARRFHRIHAAIMGEALAAEGLTAATYGAMVTIDRTPGISQRSLAEERGLDVVTTGQIIDALESQRLVSRHPHPDDRRAWSLELTARGKRVRERAAPAALAAQRRMLSVLSKDELATLQQLLARVIEANKGYDRPGAGRRPRAPKHKS